MHGVIDIQSEVDKGTMITIVIPFTSYVAKEETIEDIYLGGMHILLVEDDALNVEIEKNTVRRSRCDSNSN